MEEKGLCLVLVYFHLVSDVVCHGLWPISIESAIYIDVKEYLVLLTCYTMICLEMVS